ncbi:MAG TPA: 1-deoxy-D-xylulose-5-phosphate reductoisomerase [Bacteroidota bacterium]|nr:1-deoxy-D-xylulose-5-phosphate reductoisomerase [Bacteroidota bacterium]
MAERKNICILGSTGSIGRSSLEVIARHPDRFRVVALTAQKNVRLLEEQMARFRPETVAVLDQRAAAELRRSSDGTAEILTGEDALTDIVARPGVDIVIGSLVGFAGLRPTVEAIVRGKTVALANKETLVAAGSILNGLLRKHTGKIIPIDSEHSAILQCLAGEDPSRIERLILTASGGPFLHLPRHRFSSVTVTDALRHPTWRMGNKVTIDSATMMNKGLEVIEAHWLFSLPPDRISVVIHPQSVIHSMVEFVDGSIKAQLGVPDMKIPIQYALSWPERIHAPGSRIDFATVGEMTFLPPDTEKFECLTLAYEALRSGGTAPTVLNAANEVAVEEFLAGRINFTGIPRIIEDALGRMPAAGDPTLDEIIDCDRTTRVLVRERLAAPQAGIKLAVAK